MIAASHRNTTEHTTTHHTRYNTPYPITPPQRTHHTHNTTVHTTVHTHTHTHVAQGHTPLSAPHLAKAIVVLMCAAFWAYQFNTRNKQHIVAKFNKIYYTVKRWHIHITNVIYTTYTLLKVPGPKWHLYSTRGEAEICIYDLLPKDLLAWPTTHY